MKKGRVVAVCTSNKPGIPKHQRKSARVAKFGFAGDFHCKEMRRSFSSGGLKPNTDRHISLLAQEVIDALNKELTVSLLPGSLGENITTSGLGDLSDIPDGTLIHIGSSLVLRIMQQNDPCKVLQPLHKKMVKTIYGRRGILCSVVSGIGSHIYPNDVIVLVDNSP